MIHPSISSDAAAHAESLLREARRRAATETLTAFYQAIDATGLLSGLVDAQSGEYAEAVEIGETAGLDGYAAACAIAALRHTKSVRACITLLQGDWYRSAVRTLALAVAIQQHTGGIAKEALDAAKGHRGYCQTAQESDILNDWFKQACTKCPEGDTSEADVLAAMAAIAAEGGWAL